MSDDGDPALKIRDLDANLERHAREAAEVCPAAAITVEG
jgi:ferredoxin